ncbi:MAG: hypothetical protein HC923_08940 [Myxococcales bacterium]|nr:hypothetical protein [Myxococcales bacterium]
MVRPEEALRIIEARAQHFMSEFKNVGGLARASEREPLFPLRKSYFEEKIGDAVLVRPRQVIRWAKDAWDAEAERCRELGVEEWLAQWPHLGGRSHGGVPSPQRPWEAVVDELIASKQREQYALRKEHSGSLPADGENQTEIVRRLLEAARVYGAHALQSVEPGSPGSELDLRVTRADGTTVGFEVRGSL